MGRQEKDGGECGQTDGLITLVTITATDMFVSIRLMCRTLITKVEK